MTKPVDSNILEEILRRLDTMDNEIKTIRNNKVVNVPIRSVTRLPDGAGEGDIVIADTSLGVTPSDKSMYMRVAGQWWELRSVVPGAAAPPGPALYSLGYNSAYSVGFFAKVWQIGMNDGTGEVIVAFDDSMHKASPVWNWTVDKILYQEIPVQYSDPKYTAITNKVCLVNRDGTGRVVIYDSGISTIHNYPAYSYSVSPDGLKVAILQTSTGHPLNVYHADGSGLIATLANFPYGTPNWSADSQYVYYQGSYGISKRIFDASSAEVAVRTPYDTDYFYLSPDFTKIASEYIPSGDDGHVVLDASDGSIIYSATEPTYPWTPSHVPVNAFWNGDGTKLILDRQTYMYNGDAAAVIIDPANLSSYVMAKMSDSLGNYGEATSNPPFAQGSAVMNWAVVKVNGVEKLAATAKYGFGDGADETLGNNQGIAVYDMETGVGEWLSLSVQDTSTAGTYQDRYSVTGMPIGSWYFGAQVWDI